MDKQVASKNFFQADKVDFLWNTNGTSVLLLTSTEVDKTGGSYYGKQTLHYMSVTGETAMISLGKLDLILLIEFLKLLKLHYRQRRFCV